MITILNTLTRGQKYLCLWCNVSWPFHGLRLLAITIAVFDGLLFADFLAFWLNCCGLIIWLPFLFLTGWGNILGYNSTGIGAYFTQWSIIYCHNDWFRLVICFCSVLCLRGAVNYLCSCWCLGRLLSFIGWLNWCGLLIFLFSHDTLCCQLHYMNRWDIFTSLLIGTSISWLGKIFYKFNK